MTQRKQRTVTVNRVTKPSKRSRTETPPTSPLTSSPTRFKQSFLAIGSQLRKTCAQCGMSYLKNHPDDVRLHAKYHQRCLYGRDWHMKSEPLVKVSHDEGIYKVNIQKPYEVLAALDLLEIVNKELNAPDDNAFWMEDAGERGAVYVYVKNNVAVGVISVEKTSEGRWFSPADGVVVSSKKVELLCGVSRIYVCQEHRRKGVALRLLRCAQNHLIYGLQIPKLKVGWSQPSTSGGQLACHFNGQRHKSGKTLVPVYL